MDVALNDRGPLSLSEVCIDQRLDLVQVVGHFDSAALIRIFARLYNPDVLGVLLKCELIETLYKLRVFWIILTLNVKSQGNSNVGCVQSHSFVVIRHIQEQGFFVREMEIVR